MAKDVGGRVSPDPDYWDCNSSYDYVLNGVDTVAFLLLSLTVLGLAHVLRREIGPRAVFVGAAAAVAFGVAGIANLLEHCAAIDRAGLAYVIGLMSGMSLLVVFTVMLRRAPIPAWSVLVLLLGTLSAILAVDEGGWLAFGIALLVFGVVFIQKLSSPAPRNSSSRRQARSRRA